MLTHHRMCSGVGARVLHSRSRAWRRKVHLGTRWLNPGVAFLQVGALGDPDGPDGDLALRRSMAEVMATAATGACTLTRQSSPTAVVDTGSADTMM
jgi:hypothetical protein